ncbi:MAG: N-acetylmuramoyl-L-alanine amidase-like domain-containing protein [Rhodothermales bacterium]
MPIKKGRFGVLLISATIVLFGCNPSGSTQQHTPAKQDVVKTIALPADTTGQIFKDLMGIAKEKGWHQEELGQLMTQVGSWFSGKPYAAGTLDAPAYEQLVIKLDGFDCVTFVESVLALSRTIKDQSYDYETFIAHMRAQRYRDGVLDGYCSRLHYFSEWILDNETRGNVRNITHDVGGVKLDKQLNFMSSHRGSYAPLIDDSLYAGIIAVEEKLKTFQMYYIPQSDISTVYNQLAAGDIIALATDIGGLDVAHTGLVYKHPEGGAGLLHASTARGVVVSPDLQAYVENNKRQIGIVIARPLEVPDID